jgi:predicted DNA-binding protein
MITVATSVRITSDAMARLSKLSAKLGQPKAQVIQRALQEMEERVFWAEVQEAFALEANDPEALARARAEIASWERASEADFGDEKW